MLPQFLALESTPADKPGVGTKRGVETRSEDRVAGVQHGRGETGNGAGNLSLRHPVGAIYTSISGRHTLPFRDARRWCKGHSISRCSTDNRAGVYVGDRGGRPLMPWCPARAHRLLRSPRARVHHLTPFVIRLVDREVASSVVTGVEIDPGSKSTGVAVTTATPAGTVAWSPLRFSTGVGSSPRSWSRGPTTPRSEEPEPPVPGFNNRTRPKGWLAASLWHRVDSTMSPGSASGYREAASPKSWCVGQAEDDKPRDHEPRTPRAPWVGTRVVSTCWPSGGGPVPTVGPLIPRSTSTTSTRRPLVVPFGSPTSHSGASFATRARDEGIC